MRPRRPLRVRDPVHGFIAFSNEEAALIDAPIVQRLRGIKQLALTSLLYPGATHTRFEHSLGVMHVAGRMADHLELRKRERRLVRLAALLHDVGHMPFSHAGEAAAAGLDGGFAALGEEGHERITAALVEHDPAVRRVVRQEDDRLAILDILEKGKNRRRRRPPEPIVWQIISWKLDADKLDYLLRDSLMAGVKYGIFDIERIIDSLTAHGSLGDRHLAVRNEDLPCVEQAILARYHMSEQVYRHRVRRITDAMLRHAIMSAARLTNLKARHIVRLFRPCPDDQEWRSDFLESSDLRVHEALARLPANTRSGMLARRLAERRLLKQVFACRIKEIRYTRWRERLVKDIGRQERLARRFARAVGKQCSLVLLDIRARNNPLYRDPSLAIEEDIMVVDEQGRDERVGDAPGGLSEAAKPKEEAELYVYLPADEASRSARDQMRSRIKNELDNAAREGQP